MAIPALVTAHFVLVQAQIFGGLQVLFDVPACAQSLYHGGKADVWWSKDEEIGNFLWVLDAAAKDEPVAAIDRASLRDGQTCPIKEAFAFGAQALGQALPITSTQRLHCDAFHVA